VRREAFDGRLVVELQLEATAGVSTPPHQRGKRRG
jgi:hypothetical protein